MIISANGDYSANQSLAPVHSNANGAGGLTKSKRYDLVPGDQFMVLGVPEPLMVLPCGLLWAQRRGRR